MKRTEADQLYYFRIASRPEVSGAELLKLEQVAFQLPEGLKRDVAMIEYERRCLESWNGLLRDLKSVGYKQVEVESHFGTTTLYASPKIEPESSPPLWTYCKKYFPVHSSRGSGSTYSFQVVELMFPTSLIGNHNLEDLK